MIVCNTPPFLNETGDIHVHQYRVLLQQHIKMNGPNEVTATFSSIFMSEQLGHIY